MVPTPRSESGSVLAAADAELAGLTTQEQISALWSADRGTQKASKAFLSRRQKKIEPVDPMTAEMGRQAQDAFELLDEDGSGGLSRVEIKKAAKKLGTSLSKEQLNTAMEEMLALMPDDEKEDGEVGFGAFEHWFVGHKKAERLEQEGKLQALFAEVDVDGSGSLDKEEVRDLTTWTNQLGMRHKRAP